jgi:hypothetical protein
MASMDGWDVAFLAVAGYVAVSSLVRMMINHRDKLTARFRQEVRAEQLRKETESARQRAGRRQAA